MTELVLLFVFAPALFWFLIVVAGLSTVCSWREGSSYVPRPAPPEPELKNRWFIRCTYWIFGASPK